MKFINNNILKNKEIICEIEMKTQDIYEYLNEPDMNIDSMKYELGLSCYVTVLGMCYYPAWELCLK